VSESKKTPPEVLAVGTGKHQPFKPPASPGAQYAADLSVLEEHFERALTTMHMFFQPIVYAEDKRLFGYEGLLRPREPELPHPGAMLEAAERLSRTDKLGRAIRALLAAEFTSQDESQGLLFVNLHALDLLDKTLSSPFSPLAKIANRVVLEVTERASLDMVPDVIYRVADLRQMGYRIAIDDLGAGHARMQRFSPFDTDFVKLDISVVRDVDTHPVKQQFVASIIQLCRDQGIKVIGEGVETAEEARVLVELDCDLLQGYFIARPGPPFPSIS
jgi:EAL domain-containing protein (putative c-di-GMP-specific phosphodiesterase class I)